MDVKNLLKAQDLCQPHHQILSTISLKKLINLNVNIYMIIKLKKSAELNTNDASAVLNRQAS